MKWIKTGLWVLIYEALIINLALMDLSRMGHYIFFALLGPLAFYWGWVIINQKRAPRLMIVLSIIYLIITTVLSFIVPPILL